MTFPYVIEWTPQLRAELELVVLRDTFGGYVWPVPERPTRPVPKRKRMKPAERIAEVEWLLDGGMSPWEVAAALGTTRYNLERSMWRHGRHDLARRLYDQFERLEREKARAA